MKQQPTLYLAPMEGLTTFIYRNAFQKYYGGIDTYYSPFLSNKKLSTKEINDVHPKHNSSLRLIPQVLTNQPDTFLSVAKQLGEFGYNEINLNIGCPSGTVVAKRRGAGMLADPLQLDHFLEEIFEKCPMDISIKTRIGIEDMDEWPLLLKVYAKYPIKELIIHPRFQKEFYNGFPHKDAFVEAHKMLSCPLCYNGDITSLSSLKELSEAGVQTNVFMLGRGVLSNPLLPLAIKEKVPSDVLATQRSTFKEFHNEILGGYISVMSGDQPVLYRMKELFSYMGKYLSLDEKQLKKIRKCNSVSEYKNLVSSFIAEGNFQASFFRPE